MNILVLNAGSSSLKFSLFDPSAHQELAGGVVDWRGQPHAPKLFFRSQTAGEECTTLEITDYGQASLRILDALKTNGFREPIGWVGHRVVHGGTRFLESTLIDDSVCQALQSISELAPLHNAPALMSIAAMRAALHSADHVAVFDTAYFTDLPHHAALYPVPYEWFEKYRIRRFGFHGISHKYCAMQAAELLERKDPACLRLIICHLGNGCSAAAVRGGQPIATTMGFTPLEGLMMGTRSGSVDPGILLHLIQNAGLKASHISESLNRHSGLLGVSGVSSDFREVELAAGKGNQRAQLAIDMFVDRVRSAIGALAVTLGGIDALIFTAGIGEHSAMLRSRVCDGLACLGIQLDVERNRVQHEEVELAAPNSKINILRIRTREELMIAREAHRLSVAKR